MNENQVLVVLLLVVELSAVVVIAWWLKARARRAIAVLERENAHLRRERDRAIERAEEEYRDAESSRAIVESLKQVRRARAGGDQ